MTNIYVYIRVSSSRQADQDHASLDAQQQKCLEYVKHIVDTPIVIREVVSARNLNNQLFLLNSAVNVEDNSIIVVYNVSRFSRDAVRGIELLNAFRKRNIRVVSVMEGIDSISCRAAFRTKLVEANEESDVISDRVSGAVAFIREHGGHIGGAPFGYIVSRAETPVVAGGTYRARVLAPNQAEMSIISHIVFHIENRTGLDDIIESEPRKSKRVGVCNLIADVLNRDNRLRRGAQWTGQSVKAIYDKYRKGAYSEDMQEVDSCDSGEVCEVCKGLDSEKGNEMMLCDHCNKGFHVKCIRLPRVPKGSFFCGVICQLAGATMMEE
jgi:DNA invertase Pin-like site-specific DNA recombinase